MSHDPVSMLPVLPRAGAVPAALVCLALRLHGRGIASNCRGTVSPGREGLGWLGQSIQVVNVK